MRRNSCSRALARHPDQSPGQILESLLEHQSCRDAAAPEPPLTIESFRAWLDDFTVYSDRIPAIPGETFSRESICQDHD